MKRYINIYKCIFTNVLNLQSAYHLEMYLLEVSMLQGVYTKEGVNDLTGILWAWMTVMVTFFLVLQKLTVLYL